MRLKIAQPGMSAKKSCPNLLGPTFATGLHTVFLTYKGLKELTYLLSLYNIEKAVAFSLHSLETSTSSQQLR